MPRQITVLSGKGGAGKTSITASLIKMMEQVVAVDADVNASNLPILLPHFPKSTSSYFGMDMARLDPAACTDCGACLQVCRFAAIERTAQGTIRIADDCEGCACCAQVCPTSAIRMVERKSGEWYLSSIANGFLVHADLIPGEDNSGKLITQVRHQASEVAKNKNISYIVIDGPPGTSCQAISSVTGADLVLAVIEVSLSGLSDYRRLAELVNKFSIPHLVLLNKAGAHPQVEERILAAVAEFGGTPAGRIPFDRAIPQALQELQCPSDIREYRHLFADLLDQLESFLL